MEFKRIQGEIKVGECYDCPFKIEELVRIGEMTWDTEVYCGLKKTVGYKDVDCYWAQCPLRKRGRITVKWEDK